MTAAILVLAGIGSGGSAFSQSSTHKVWWKEAVVYQVYPRSFKDSDGDGLGDIKGIISKLDYIKSLGVDVIWLNPVFQSPNADNGYDISDYYAIMKDFGTMQDFDALLKGMHERKIRLVLDLVVNHTSDEHEWFRQARSSRDNPYRDFYHWWPAERGTPPYRWSGFDAQGSAWKYDSLTNAYYLHYFVPKQPDLNWENPVVRREVYKMMDFWFQKGIDGFRMDVITAISKDTTWPVIPKDTITHKYNGDWRAYYSTGPYVHDYLQEMNREVLRKYDIMTVAEGWGVVADHALKFADEDRRELNMLYHFQGMDIRHLPASGGVHDPRYDLVRFKKLYTRWDSIFARKGWGTVYLGNHDQSRMVSRWGNDDPQYRVLSSKMLTTFLLTMRATPYYMAGDELGMTSIKFSRIEDYQDVKTINNYKRIHSEGGDVQAYLEDQKLYSRDNGRTPFQWDSTANAGFTTGVPWLKVNGDFRVINAAAQEEDPDAPLNYFRKLVQLRKQNKVLVYGKYTLLDAGNKKVYSYTREGEGKKVLVLLNFSAGEAVAHVSLDTAKAKMLLSNYKDITRRKAGSAGITLRPYEAVIYQLP